MSDGIGVKVPEDRVQKPEAKLEGILDKKHRAEVLELEDTMDYKAKVQGKGALVCHSWLRNWSPC